MQCPIGVVETQELPNLLSSVRFGYRVRSQLLGVKFSIKGCNGTDPVTGARKAACSQDGVFFVCYNIFMAEYIDPSTRRFMDVMRFVDKNGIEYTGEAAMLAMLLHTRKTKRGAKEEQELRQVMGDQNLD